jgi:cyclohexanecarboxylate-CoA ligase
VAEVEQLLFEHPDVREVAIVAMPDPVMTERACAFVVAEPRTTPTLADLCAFLETKKIARQKFPERLELIPELPKTLSGKIQKFRLREVIRDKLMASEAAPRRKESTP